MRTSTVAVAPSMSSAVQEVRKSLLKLAQTWPKDPLRPTMDFGGAIRRATEAELSGPQARQHLAEARKSLAALERIRSNESMREVRFMTNAVPDTPAHSAA